jgi:hypothetical protein
MLKSNKYYDRSWKVWVVRLLDEEGNQIGDCEYTKTKYEATQTEKQMMEDIKNEPTNPSCNRC